MAEHDTLIAEMYLAGHSLKVTAEAIGKNVSYVGYRRSQMIKWKGLRRMSKRLNHRPCDYDVIAGSIAQAFEKKLTQQEREWVVRNARGNMTVADVFVMLVRQAVAEPCCDTAIR